jgi:cellulose synthase (UDP-forming)
MPVTPILDEDKKSTLPSYQLHFRLAAHVRTMRWLVAAATLCLLYMLWGLVMVAHPGYAPLYWLLLASLGYKVLWMVHEWVHYVQVQEPVPPAQATRRYTVDMLTTACPGEPHAMIIRTLEAMQAVHYPHTSYLCDEGNDPALRAVCERLGVVHVTRQVKINAKAGNINNALRQATGELCVVLDPDHVPTPDFLDWVTPYFADEQVGFVQVVQAYGNQHESLVARGAAEQTYHFYGPLMMGMNAYGTVQAIGANCTFRRAALDSIGGHASGLTEDMHTAMRMHAAGWKSAYVPQVVSRGLVPASLAAFYAQQLKWSRGAFDLLFRVYPKLCGRFSWAQRLHYFFLPLYFFSGVISFIDLALPIFGLGTSQFPLVVRLGDLAQYTMPLLVVSLLIRYQAQRWLREPGEGGMHWAGSFLLVGGWWVYLLGFVYAVLGVKVPYIPTPKEGLWHNEWRLALPNLLLIGMLLGACAYGHHTAPGYYTNLMTDLALINVAILLAVLFMGLHQTVRHLIQSLASRPVRWLVLGGHRFFSGLSNILVRQVRQFSVGLALASLVASGAVYEFRLGRQAKVPAAWLMGNDPTLHLGRAVATPSAQLVSTTPVAGILTAPADPSYTIAAMPLVGAEPLTETVARLAPTEVPLVSWTVDAVETWKPSYWRHLARQVASLPRPVLLRPRLATADDAASRRAWQHMVLAFKQENVANALWVWTPEAGDSLLHRFPGVAYANWLASPLQASEDGLSYPTLRAQLVTNLSMHQVPVLLLAPPPAGSPQRFSNQLAVKYPEIKALVFMSTTRSLAPNAHASLIAQAHSRR